jgi:predicted nicotinamide N-methyase
VGGFDADLIIMEDADLCLRMHMDARAEERRRGVIRMLPSVVQTSGRRIGSWGSWWATYVQFRIALQWYLGTHPHFIRQKHT